MTDDRAYWFKAKSYGIGWSLPAAWQGWLTLLVYFASLTAGFTLLSSPERRAAFVLIVTAMLVAVVAWKGERPFRWRWGRR